MIRLIKVAILGFLNLQVFFRIVSFATSFARVNSGAYIGITAELLLVTFTISLFMLFRNLGVLIFLLSNLEDGDYKTKILSVGKWTLFILFLYLVLQFLPEFAIRDTYQIQQ